MSDIVIQAESLGKKYTTGHQTERGRDVALRDVNAKAQRRRDAKLSIFSILHSPLSILPSLFSLLYSPFSILPSLFSLLPSPPEEGWALKVASSESRRGEFKPKYGIIETMTSQWTKRKRGI